MKRRLSRLRNPRRARVACWFRFLRPAKGPGDAAFKERLSIHPPEYLDQFRNDPGPPGLVAGADARPVIAMEILVEEEVVAPVRIGLEFLGPAIHRPPPR